MKDTTLFMYLILILLIAFLLQNYAYQTDKNSYIKAYKECQNAYNQAKAGYLPMNEGWTLNISHPNIPNLNDSKQPS